MMVAQTKTTATIEIVIMLVVAALIGYLTSYFYHKAIYTRKIQVLEKEKENLNARIVRLNADKGDLEKRLKLLEDELAGMKEKDSKKPQKT